MRFGILAALVFGFISSPCFASLPDLTGNYTGCGQLSSLGKRQAVLVLVRMATGFGPNDFKYSGGFYWKDAGSGVDFFTDVKVDEISSRLLMNVESKPLHDFGEIAKNVDAKILPDGSIQGTFVTNSTGSDGRFQSGTFHVVRTNGPLSDLKCAN